MVERTETTVQSLVCPECGAPAEVDRISFPSSTEPEGWSIALRTLCAAGHRLLSCPETTRSRMQD